MSFSLLGRPSCSPAAMPIKSRPITKISCESGCPCYQNAACYSDKRLLQEAGLLEDLKLQEGALAFLFGGDQQEGGEPRKKQSKNRRREEDAVARRKSDDELMDRYSARARLRNPMSLERQAELAARAYATSRFLFHLDLSTPEPQAKFSTVYADTIEWEKTKAKRRARGGGRKNKKNSKKKR